MPKSDNGKGGLQGLMARVNRSLDTLYTSTYYATPNNAKALDTLRDRIDSNIDKIVNANMDTMGIPSVSKLYSRMKLDLDKRSDMQNQSIADYFDTALNYDDFFATFQNNRYLLEMDAEIDSTCKYFPDLEEALMVLKEGVLSPDYFSKDFLTLATTDSNSKDDFDENVKQMKQRYNLLPFIEDAYYHASKYGEDFIYCVPYATALSRLLTDKPKTSYSMANIEHESSTFTLAMNESSCIITDSNNRRVSETKPIIFTEVTSAAQSVKDMKKGKTSYARSIQESATPILHGTETFKLNIEICRRGIIESVITHTKMTNERRHFIESVCDEYDRTVVSEKGDLKVVKKDKKSGKLVIHGMEDEMNDESLTSDGMINLATQDKSGKNKVKVDVPGCVLARVKREQVIPIYIGENNTCLGYYYIEIRSYEALEDFRGLNYIMSDSLTSIRGSNSGMNAPFNCVDPSRQEELLKYVAGQISQLIDKEFVNANQDLRQEIYMILKYNDLFNTPAIDKVKITFIPPEDMIHVYFQLDPVTHRGISDLDKAMVPAKIYASMYITDAIGKLVRGQDKRVYYVKQQVDTNISQTLMNVINQVKQGNFGFRQFSNINNVLNITGKFNDLFIPTSASGESPIQIETMPGQQFTDNSEFMQQLKEMAVNTIVPFEIVQTRLSVDYAMQLSMSNSKFLRKIYARQSIFIPFLSRLVTKIYNFEYGENIEVKATLPPPVFINTMNTNQLVDNTKQFVQNLAEIELANEEDDKVKNEYIKKLFQFYIGTHIDISRHEEVLRQAMMEVEKEKNAADQQ